MKDTKNITLKSTYSIASIKKQKKKKKAPNKQKTRIEIISLSLVAKLCLTFSSPWTVACQALLSMGFSRQEYLKVQN